MDAYKLALDLMAATPAALQALMTLPAETLERKPGPEAWSIQEVLKHMLHVETAVIGERVRLMLREHEPHLQPAPGASQPGSAREILAQWLKAREENLALLRTLTSEQLGRAGRHPHYGTVTVREHVVEWAYHDLDHLRQILAAIQSALYADIGVFQALYPKPA